MILDFVEVGGGGRYEQRYKCGTYAKKKAILVDKNKLL